MCSELLPNAAGPFGLLCFGMTTDMLMFIVTGWGETAFEPTVFCYAAFYGGLGQLIAGILEVSIDACRHEQQDTMNHYTSLIRNNFTAIAPLFIHRIQL